MVNPKLLDASPFFLGDQNSHFRLGAENFARHEVPFVDLIPAGIAEENMVKVLREKYDKRRCLGWDTQDTEDTEDTDTEKGELHGYVSPWGPRTTAIAMV